MLTNSLFTCFFCMCHWTAEKHYVPMFLCSLCNFACVIDTETVQRLLRHKWRIYALELVLQIWQYSDEFFSKMNTLNEFSKTHDLTRSFFHARKSQDSIFPGKFLIYQLEHHTSNGYDSLLYNKLCFYWRLLAKRRNPCSISFFFLYVFLAYLFRNKSKKNYCKFTIVEQSMFLSSILGEGFTTFSYWRCSASITS